MGINTISLSDESVKRDTPSKLDYHLNCFFWSRHSQSVYYRGRIFSLTKLLQLYGNDAVRIGVELEKTIQELLSLRFTTATCNVRTTEENGAITVYIDATVSDDSDPQSGVVSVGFTLLISDSKLKRLLSGLSDRPIYISE